MRGMIHADKQCLNVAPGANTEKDLARLKEFIEVARGLKPAELVLKNGRVVNVFSGEIYGTDVAIHHGKIAGLGNYRGLAEVDIGGGYIAPGFIDGHVHLESSKLTFSEYAQAVVPRGTTAVVMDPHEIANVLGLAGIQYLLAASAEGPLSAYLMLSSCVPATNFETSGGRLSADDLASLIENPRVLGIAELMNYPGVLSGDSEILRKIQLGSGKRVDGHAPGVTGKDLCAYVGAGISSDHESTTREEAFEKLRLGMHVMIREGSMAKNLEELVPLVQDANGSRFSFVSDDRSPEDLSDEGHLDYMARKAVALGLMPVAALQMMTINTASYFGVRDLGAVAPGYRADIVVLEDLEGFRVKKVFNAGRLVAENGRLLRPIPFNFQIEGLGSMNVNWSGLARLPTKAESDTIKVIELITGQIVNKKVLEKWFVAGEYVTCDLARDIVKVAVIERHHATGNIGVGFVRGFGLREGALASTVAHDSHNIIAVGTTDQEIEAAAREVASMGGGQAVVSGGKPLATLSLPIVGLMSDRPLEEVTARAKALKEAAKNLGCPLADPFMALSFLALPVVPELRLTDLGLVDVNRHCLVSLFGES